MGISGKRKLPVSLLAAVCGWMSAGLVSVTVAPGSTAPVSSVTLPVISPVWTCASAGIAPTNMASRASMAVKRTFIFSLPRENGRTESSDLN